MTKATSNRKHVIGALLTVSEGESIKIMMGNMGPGRWLGQELRAYFLIQRQETVIERLSLK